MDMTIGQDGPPGPPQRMQRRFYYGALLVLSIPSVIAVVVAQGQQRGAWSDGLLWALYMVAAAAVAALLGLVFGVPRSRTDYSAESTERYSSNSNLEQISDWLTKLLVGAGLVEIGNLWGALKSAGHFLGAGMRVANGDAFSAAAIVYGAGAGFAGGYLWTRLRLRLLLERSDRAAAEASRFSRQIAARLRQASPAPESEPDLLRVADNALSLAREPNSPRHSVLWVDDNPGNVRPLVDALLSLQIPVDQVRTMGEALTKVRTGDYGVVVTDTSRVDDGTTRDEQAGLHLIQALRKDGNRIPIFVYTQNKGLDHRDDLVTAGASLVTNLTGELFPRIVRAVAS